MDTKGRWWLQELPRAVPPRSLRPQRALAVRERLRMAAVLCALRERRALSPQRQMLSLRLPGPGNCSLAAPYVPRLMR